MSALLRLLAFVALACAGTACASDLPLVGPPLLGMEEPLEQREPPQDEAARVELPLGSFTGLTVGDARTSLDAMLDEPDAVVALTVVENSPADAAGIEVGDLVLEAVWNDRVLPMHWPSEWRRLELEAEPGTRLRLLVDRAGMERELELTTVARVHPAGREPIERIREEERVGVVLRTATEVEARAAGLGPGGGAVVVGLTRESPWRAAGLVYGDLIRSVDGAEVASPALVVDRIRAAEPDATLELGLVRAGQRLVVQAPVSERAGEMTLFHIPLVFKYEKERDQRTTSALLGLYRYQSTPAAWRLRLFWLLRFSGGDADRLESVPR